MSKDLPTNLTQLANDTSTNPHFIECVDHETRAELDVPIKVAGRVLGVLGIESHLPHAFREYAVPFIETLADQIAVAIENARLMERARELAASDERNRLAREIHDTLAQSLIAVSMELDAIDRRLERVNPPDRHLQVEVLGAPVLLGRGAHLDVPGEPEQRIGEGADVTLAAGAKGTYVAWTTGGAVLVRTPSSPQPVTAAEHGAFPTLLALPDGKVK